MQLPLTTAQLDELVHRALAEDLGDAGDLTSNAVLTGKERMEAAFVARQPGVVSGIDVARAAFRLVDSSVTFEAVVQDGAKVSPGTLIAKVSGSAKSILIGERVALNFMSRMSGIASATAVLVQAVAGSKAKIACTRKTTPGLRALEKYAVRCGGGMNHRFGLYDAVLIKDNHIAAAGGVTQAIQQVRSKVGHLVKVEIEVDSIEQLREALPLKPDVIMLDNMKPDALKRCVELVNGRCLLEASGRVTAETAAAIAATGVDIISVGWITHSAPILDIGLDVVAQ